MGAYQPACDLHFDVTWPLITGTLVLGHEG